MGAVVWHRPETRADALRLRSEHGGEGIVVAGATFLGVLMNHGLLAPEAMISLAGVRDLDFIHEEDGALRIGAMTTHRRIEDDPLVARLSPALARTFSLVASARIRNWATIGGVLANGDHASDPPSMLTALGARAVIESLSGRREVAVEDLVLGLYETVIAADEILTEVIVPAGTEAATYRKFRTRSHEDRPCVSVAAARRGGVLRLAVGAVTQKVQFFPEICELSRGRLDDPALAREMAAAYAAAIDPVSDARAPAEYRRRIIEVELRRAIEELMP